MAAGGHRWIGRLHGSVAIGVREYIRDGGTGRRRRGGGEQKGLVLGPEHAQLGPKLDVLLNCNVFDKIPFGLAEKENFYELNELVNLFFGDLISKKTIRSYCKFKELIIITLFNPKAKCSESFLMNF